MTDLIGPASAPNSTTTRPALYRIFGAVDTWFRDCSTPASQDGTAYQADFFNGVLAQIRNAIRGNGSLKSGAGPVVPEVNSNDAMLLDAIELLIARGQPNCAVDTGTSDALVAAPATPWPEYVEGARLWLVKSATAGANATTTPTVAVSGLAPLEIVRRDGSPVAIGDLPGGIVLPLEVHNNAFRLVSVALSDVMALGGVVRVTDGTPPASTANALVGTASPAISAYEPNQVFIVTSSAAITAANPTLNVTGAGGVALGALPIVRPDGSALVASPTPDIAAGVEFMVALDAAGAKFRFLGQLPSVAVAAVNAGKTLLYYKPGSYTWTCPPGITQVKILGRGAGGGGGGSVSSGGYAAGGGSGGSYFIGNFTVVPGTTYIITVGAGGTAGSAAGSNGGNGGATSFGSLATAPGGLGGQVGNSNDPNGIGSGGAAPAVATSSAANGFVTAGYIGGGGQVISGTGEGGTGGGSYGQGTNLNPVGGGAGYQGFAPGVGGNGGGGNNYAGGAGGPGELILEF